MESPPVICQRVYAMGFPIRFAANISRLLIVSTGDCFINFYPTVPDKWTWLCIVLSPVDCVP